MKVKKVNLTKALDLLGYTVLETKRNYNMRSGYAKDKVEGTIVYFSFSDLRDERPTLLVRRVSSVEHDSKGKIKYDGSKHGNNTYPLGYMSQNHQYDFYPEVKRTKIDYNEI